MACESQQKLQYFYRFIWQLYLKFAWKTSYLIDACKWCIQVLQNIFFLSRILQSMRINILSPEHDTKSFILWWLQNICTWWDTCNRLKKSIFFCFKYSLNNFLFPSLHITTSSSSIISQIHASCFNCGIWCFVSGGVPPDSTRWLLSWVCGNPSPLSVRLQNCPSK